MADIQVMANDVRSDKASYQIFDKYHALRTAEIRVLELLPPPRRRIPSPSHLQTRIECNVIHARLESDVQYEALSYCWGNSKPTEEITIVNHGNHRFQVTKSLLAALLQFRKTNESRLIWIDFLCINQRDKIERAQQVSQMTTIYRRATQVLGWLGEADNSDESVFKFSQYLQNGTHDLEHFNPAWLTALSAFLSKPFFSRIWIIQEVALARRLLLCFGKYEMKWEDLRDLLDRLLEQYGDVMNTSNTDVGLERMMMLCSTRNLVTDHIVQTKTQTSPFFAYQTSRMDQHRSIANVEEGDYIRFVNRSRTFGSTDPRDRVFALGGLVPENWRDATVDYSSKNTPDVVFHSFTIRTMLRMQNLDILAQAGIHESSLPSWVPDYTRRLPYHPLNIDEYNANNETFQVQPSSSPQALRVSGYKIGTIQQLRMGFQNSQTHLDDSVFTTPWRPGPPPPLERTEILERTIANTVDIVSHQYYREKLGAKASLDDYQNFGESLKSGATALYDLATRRTPRISTDLENTWRAVAMNSSSSSSNDPAIIASIYRNTLIGGPSLPGLPLELCKKYLGRIEALWLDNIRGNPWRVRGGPGNGDEVPVEIKVAYLDANGEIIKDAGFFDRSRKKPEPSPWITDYYHDAKKMVKKLSTPPERKGDGLGQRQKTEMDRKIAEYENRPRAVKRQDDLTLKQVLARTFNRAVERMSRGRKFAITDKELGMAWVPQLAQEGDEIWILVGGRVPFVLRPVLSGSGVPRTFRLVGESFHYGVMQGEYSDGEYARNYTSWMDGPCDFAQKEYIELI